MNETNELSWMNWNERIETKELTWINWKEWIDMKELTWSNWNTWLETHELIWMTWNEWIDMSELKWVTWQDWLEMNEFNEWIELNEWNEWIEMNDLTWMNWNEWTETNDLRWMICRPHLQKVARSCQFFAIFVLNPALATVSCTFCRPLSGSRRATAETPSSSDPRHPPTATLPEKEPGIAPESVFSSEFTCSRSLPKYFMMMRLTWWCGWRDDWDADVVAMMVRQLAIDNCP